ncbi:MAG TPA: hypothetical protein VF045_08710 [Acidimicrobiales bacterium]
MTEHAGFRLLVRTLTGVVLLVSGGYLMVYLYRWEWNRALISGIFFLAAEVAVVTTLLFARLGRLERRLDEQGLAGPAVADQLPPEPGSEESPFAWLNPADGRMGVFVPLLMGAGVILSAIAFVIEKVSGAMARAGSGAQVAPAPALLPPAGNFLEASRARGSTPAAAPPRARRSAMSGVLLATGLLAFPIIGLVADATQTRPDPNPDRTTLELDVRVRDARESAAEEAAALPVACQGKVRLDRIEVEAVEPGRARLVLTGVLGDSARRKFTGCLQDATLDGVRATVVALVTEPHVPPKA